RGLNFVFALLSSISTTAAVPTLLYFATTRNINEVQFKEGLLRGDILSSDFTGTQTTTQQKQSGWIYYVYTGGIESQFVLENGAKEQWRAAGKIPYESIIAWQIHYGPGKYYSQLNDKSIAARERFRAMFVDFTR
ncbi:uncharacterized protein PgNI_00826, partial [Pyricularia grisea]|uniref:Uncharacterized protein n=1 Tax=Pyricularia grisea TaxID=148305 RepID=A0A6P8BHB7_PYRGI